MINHLSRKEKLVCSGEDALYAIKVIDAAYKSAKLGREVKVE
jgi:predicted dehydrogenase